MPAPVADLLYPMMVRDSRGRQAIARAPADRSRMAFEAVRAMRGRAGRRALSSAVGDRPQFMGTRRRVSIRPNRLAIASNRRSAGSGARGTGP